MKTVYKFVVDRLRVFVFCIAVAILGLINPAKALQSTYKALDGQEWE